MARQYNSYSYWDYLSHFSLPLHLSFFVMTLFFIIGLTWYINYEYKLDYDYKLEDFMNQVKFFLMITPVILLLLVHCVSSGGFRFFVPFSEGESLHRAGCSPWGVAALLVFLIFVISHQSSLHEKWFPLIIK